MAQLYRVGNPIDREERANLNLTLDDILSRFSLMQSQINFLSGGADTEALIQEIRQAIADAEQATEDTEGAIANVDLKLQELELEIEKAKDLKPVGEWNATTNYKQNNIVSKDGNSYIALVDNTNVDVTNTNTWQLSAAKGDKGDTGKGLSIKGKLDDPSELPPAANYDEGDAFYVGQDLWVIIGGTWDNVGQIKGDPGSDADVTAANIELALGYVPADEGIFENFGMQYEFRNPTIAGRQLRITKPSNSNRIPLLLNNDIEDGTAITVSLDNGTTSIQLKNVDGTDVTKLEKGFIEIVKTGSFFTLRNKGGLSQADLDALITLVNEADINDSTLRSQYVNEINNLEITTPLDADSSWNQILLKLPEINSSRKKYKQGNATFNSNPVEFRTYGTNSAVTLYAAVVPFSDIGFIPNKIIIYPPTNAQNRRRTEYFRTLGNFSEYAVVSTNSTDETSSASNTAISVTNSVNAYVNDTGFSLPIANTGSPYTWEAYE